MDKKHDNEVYFVAIAAVFIIAMILFDYLKSRGAAEQHQEWMTQMSRDIDASSQARVERMTAIVEAQRRRRQPLQLQITHVHSSTCGHLPHDGANIYSEPYYQRLWRQRRRYQGRQE